MKKAFLGWKKEWTGFVFAVIVLRLIYAGIGWWVVASGGTSRAGSSGNLYPEKTGDLPDYLAGLLSMLLPTSFYLPPPAWRLQDLHLSWKVLEPWNGSLPR